MKKIYLEVGDHSDPCKGTCLLEAVSVVMKVPFSDDPDGVDDNLAAMGRRLNDTLDDEPRQLLVHLIPKIVDAKSNRWVQKRRKAIVINWLVRSFLPRVLEVACPDHLREWAPKFRELRPIKTLAKHPYQSLMDRFSTVLLASEDQAYDGGLITDSYDGGLITDSYDIVSPLLNVGGPANTVRRFDSLFLNLNVHVPIVDARRIRSETVNELIDLYEQLLDA